MSANVDLCICRYHRWKSRSKVWDFELEDKETYERNACCRQQFEVTRIKTILTNLKEGCLQRVVHEAEQASIWTWSWKACVDILRAESFGKEGKKADRPNGFIKTAEREDATLAQGRNLSRVPGTWCKKNGGKPKSSRVPWSCWRENDIDTWNLSSCAKATLALRYQNNFQGWAQIKATAPTRISVRAIVWKELKKEHV